MIHIAPAPLAPGAWARHAWIWLRMHGFATGGEGGFAVLPAGAGPEALAGARGVLADGPLAPGLAAALGLGTQDRHAARLDLEVPDLARPFAPGETGDLPFTRHLDRLKPIPAARGETTAIRPAPLADGDDGGFAWQALEPGPGWQVLAYATDPRDGFTAPVLLSDGTRIVSGLPFLETACEKLAMPDFAEAFLDMAAPGFPWRLDRWMAGQIGAHAAAAGATVLYLGPWPAGCEAALTIRHDYDRKIPAETLEALLAVYDRLGLRASVGFLARLPVPEQMTALRARGHEVTLHSEAGTPGAMTDEIARLGPEAGEVRGVTCHGGTGSAGFLGARTHAAAAALGLAHAEQLGRRTVLPHPALGRDSTGATVRQPLMVAPLHMSLDRTTAPRGHWRAELAAEIPLRLAAGGAVNLMNHPDIHVPELVALLEGLDLSRVWCATHDQMADWARIALFDSRIGMTAEGEDGGEGIALAFDRPLPHDLPVALMRGTAGTRAIVPAGSTAWTLPAQAAAAHAAAARGATAQGTATRGATARGAAAREGMQGENTAMAPRSETLLDRLGRGIERAARSFRRPAPAPDPAPQAAPEAKATAKAPEAKAAPEPAAPKPAPAPAPTLTQPERGAIIARTLDEARAARDALPVVKGLHRYRPADVRLFALAHGAAGLSPDPDQAASFLHADADGLFDLVVIDPAVRIFDDAFGQAFIAAANGLAAPGGHLLIPDWGAQAAKGTIPPARLAQWLGTEGRPGPEGYLIFPRAEAMAAPASVLSWYRRAGPSLVLAEMMAARDPEAAAAATALDPLAAEFLAAGQIEDRAVRGARSGDSGTGDSATVPADPAAMLDELISSHGYLVTGIAYKAAILRYILDTLLPGRTGLRYADIGGGFGALAAELVATAPPERFAAAVTRDIAPQNVALARALHTGLHGALAGRVRFSLGAAESFPFAEGYDVVSFVGSLLYVPRDRLDGLIGQVWDGLAPGGLLVVHENIRNPAYTRDHDVMFTAEEIEGLMARLGPVSHFSSGLCARMKPESVGNRTVFRAVQKPA